MAGCPPWGLAGLTMRTGAVVARRLVWGYDMLDGAEALRLGVADHCVPEGAALTRAIEIAQKMARLPAVAVDATKRFFRDQTASKRRGAGSRSRPAIRRMLR